MYDIDENITIANKLPENDLNFEYLRSLAQKYIERYGRKLWTDYNIKDPGITMMELLCYAITDLGLRVRQPMENLLAHKDGKIQTKITDENGCVEHLHKQFHTAIETLTCKPVNEDDYRKLFIDIPGVKNAWVLPYHKMIISDQEGGCKHEVKGLNSVLVDYEVDEKLDRNEINQAIFKSYHANRNLCEDLVEIKEVDKLYIQLCGREFSSSATSPNDHIQYIIECYLWRCGFHFSWKF